MTKVSPEISAELFAETIAAMHPPAELGKQALEGATQGSQFSVDLEQPLARLGTYIETARNNPETRVLYEEQVPVMEDLYDFLVTHEDDPRGRIVLPTGVGKTVLFTEFVKATGMRALVLTPTTSLLAQTEKAFNKFGGDDEITVGKVYGGQKDETGQVTITTYASFVRHTKNEDSPYLGPGKYDLIICDEAHHAMAPGTRAALAQYDGAIKIGLTATEDYSAKKKLEHDFPHLVHKMEMREAIESGLITPFTNWAVETETDMSGVRISATNDYDIEQLQKTVNNELRNQLAVDMYRTYFAGQKAFFFTSGVEHAKDLAQMLRDAGVRAEAIHGGLSDKKQEALIEMLRLDDDQAGLMVLTNDKIAAEGVDVVNVTVCFNLAPTLSYVRARQRGGRILRLDPDNPSKHAYIIDFIDKNYRKPPVLFADPDVAGAAQIGGADPEEPTLFDISYNLGTARVMKSPEAVEMMADSFSESRKDKRLPAPEGWLTISGIASYYDISVTDARKVIGRIKEYVPDLIDSDSGRFLSRGTTDGLTTYYSERIIDGMNVLMDDVLDRLDPPPESWLSVAQVAYIYGEDYVKTKQALRHTAAVSEDEQNMRGTFKPARPFKGTKTEYFHPDIVRKYSVTKGFEEWDGVPPISWVSEVDIRDLYGAKVTQEVLRRGIRKQSGLFSGNVLTYDGQKYFGRYTHKWIKDNVKPPQSWVVFDEVVALADAPPAVVNEVIDMLVEKKPADAPYISRWCFTENGEQRFIHNVRVEEIVKYIDKNRRELVPSRNVDQDLQEFADGEVINIPRAELVEGLAVPDAQAGVGEIEVTIARKKRLDIGSSRSGATKKETAASRGRTAKVSTRILLSEVTFEHFEPAEATEESSSIEIEQDRLHVNLNERENASIIVQPDAFRQRAVGSKVDLMKKYRR